MLNSANLRLLPCVALTAILVACGRSNTAPAHARHYDVKGIIRGAAPDRSSVDVEHEDIPRFMPSMTMTISVHEPKEIANVRTGDAISFRMVVTDNDLYLENVKKIDATQVRLSVHTPTPTPAATSTRLQEGDALPNFALTDQHGGRVTNQTFLEHPLILTFVFTRCPVPNFCPRMSGNFAELQKAIQSGQIPNTHLMSITLDPAFDTPAILQQYADHLGADPAIWTFATGDVDRIIEAFSIYRQTEAGTLSHGLATALIDPRGKISRIWRGNSWTPDEVIGAAKTLTH